MVYQVAINTDLNEIINMKNRVKRRIINANLPMWLNGYPNDEYIQDDLTNNYGRVVKVNDKIVAYASFYSSESEYLNEIENIQGCYSFGRVMVDDGFVGLGIGKFLVLSMINEAKRIGSKAMIITGDDFNKIAINLYTKLGFKKIGEKQFSYAYLSIYKLEF